MSAKMKRREFIALIGGAAVAWPLAARAQQRTGKIPRVGFLLNVQSELVVALFEGLRDAGYIDGQNMVVETRFSGTMPDRITDFANELVALNCDVLFAAGPYAIQALTRATSTIPIVAIDLESDPIANGWASSIGRPGGNLTGFFLDLPELGGKQIELLKEAVPTLSRLALLWDSTVGLIQFRATEAAARTAGVVPLSANSATPSGKFGMYARVSHNQTDPLPGSVREQTESEWRVYAACRLRTVRSGVDPRLNQFAEQRL
jgi:putative tryptophan/tyrosine transport system substrate-binding protein